jgi:hypothetical protein
MMEASAETYNSSSISNNTNKKPRIPSLPAPGPVKLLVFNVCCALLTLHQLQFVPEVRTLTQRSLRLERNRKQQQQLPKSSRVLWGIFSSDSVQDELYRSKFRHLFGLHYVTERGYGSPRVCSLSNFLKHQHEDCQLIYTFVVGRGGPDAPTRLRSPDFASSTDMIVSKPVSDPVAPDLNLDDMTLLNLKYVVLANFSNYWIVPMVFSATTAEH